MPTLSSVNVSLRRVAAGLAATLLLAAPASVAAQTFFEFPIPTASSRPTGITAGPDGNLWFTEFNGNKIGRITPAGVITEFPIPSAGGTPFGITAGPDGNLWFTEYFGNKIGQVITAPFPVELLSFSAE